MRRPDLAEIDAFVAIAEHRSFAKAAAQLGLAPSTLSETLRKLEERLGVRLIDRTTRSVAVTEAGERLLARLRPMLDDYEAALESINAFRDKPAGVPYAPTRFPAWPDELEEIIYVDHYGNAITGLRAAALPPDARLGVADRVLARMRTFSDVPTGAAFCYENANGLMEVAVNGGRADAVLGLAVGSKLTVVP